jgi:phosphatidylglycerol:prolipoprotein diacylglycerol transferase
VPSSRHRRLATGWPSSLQIMAFSCAPLQHAEPQALGLTYWFDAAPEGSPYSVAVRFQGRRLGVKGRPGPEDSFTMVDSVERVIPGTGRQALTARVAGVAAGEWRVTVAPVAASSASTGGGASPRVRRPNNLPRATASGATAFAPVVRVRAPGVRLGAWPTLVSIGAAVGLGVQGVLAAHRQISAGRLLLISLVACVAGVVGGKLYYRATHRREKFRMLVLGMSVQGFVLAAVATVVLGAWLLGIPIGRALDVTAPGLLFGMSIGRMGCFLGGCCAGRPTASRWGLWSSNRRLGVRRVPVQLFESALAGLLGAAAALTAWSGYPHHDGLVFVASIAAYTLARQLLFPLREIPRLSRHGRQITLSMSVLVLVVNFLISILVR